MAIIFKKGVKLSGMTTQCWAAVHVAEGCFDTEGVDTVVTSINDGKHGRGSKHYIGNAPDLRSKHLPSLAAKKRVLALLKARLTNEFDILLEDIGEPNEHYHIEWDPKTR